VTGSELTGPVAAEGGLRKYATLSVIVPVFNERATVGEIIRRIRAVDLPLEVSAIDSFPSATDAPERRLSIVARYPVSLARILAGEELLCDAFDRALAVSEYLLAQAPVWLGQD